jgi:hypothetical protein
MQLPNEKVAVSRDAIGPHVLMLRRHPAPDH